jgi:hypothetical protein
MHQKTRMIDVHMSLLCDPKHERDIHQSTSSASTLGSQSKLPQRLGPTPGATTPPRKRCCRSLVSGLRGAFSGTCNKIIWNVYRSGNTDLQPAQCLRVFLIQKLRLYTRAVAAESLGYLECNVLTLKKAKTCKNWNLKYHIAFALLKLVVWDQQ